MVVWFLTLISTLPFLPTTAPISFIESKLPYQVLALPSVHPSIHHLNKLGIAIKILKAKINKLLSSAPFFLPPKTYQILVHRSFIFAPFTTFVLESKKGPLFSVDGGDHQLDTEYIRKFRIGGQNLISVTCRTAYISLI